VHVSQLSNRFVKDPNEVVKPGDRVTVRVLSVDVPRQRIALTMKDAAAPSSAAPSSSAPAQPRADARPRRDEPKPEPKRAPEPPKPGVAPNGMRIVTRK
jgi:uncharacterized protein